ncbi:MAG: class I SAM-dependent methyltransferase [Phycisphaerales bacterium]|nr:class I SAM-dependent methyltransferase [Phycisphaerales bacterium]
MSTAIITAVTITRRDRSLTQRDSGEALANGRRRGFGAEAKKPTEDLFARAGGADSMNFASRPQWGDVVTTVLQACPVLAKMYEAGETTAADGAPMAIHSHLPAAYAEALFRTVARFKPAVCVEIGMALGTSALAILAGLEAAGGGKLISIDPKQKEKWRGAGCAAVERAGYGEHHELIAEPDYLALPPLLRLGLRVDFGYIDGWHTFDHALLDFWYLDRMMPVGGVVGFNDCGMAGVDKTIGFVQSHRKYEEIDAGLPVNYGRLGRTRLLGRLLRGRSRGLRLRQHQDRYFRKGEDWQAPWDFFAPF